MLKKGFMIFYWDYKKLFLKSKLNSVFWDYFINSDPSIEVILEFIKGILEQEGFFVALNPIKSLLNCNMKNLVGKIFSEVKLNINKTFLNQFQNFQYAISNQTSINNKILFSAIYVLFSNLFIFLLLGILLYWLLYCLVNLVSYLLYLVIVRDFCR